MGTLKLGSTIPKPWQSSTKHFSVGKAERRHVKSRLQLIGLDVPRSEMCHKTSRVVPSEVFRWCRFISLVATVSI